MKIEKGKTYFTVNSYDGIFQVWTGFIGKKGDCRLLADKKDNKYFQPEYLEIANAWFHCSGQYIIWSNIGTYALFKVEKEAIKYAKTLLKEIINCSISDIEDIEHELAETTEQLKYIENLEKDKKTKTKTKTKTKK